MAQVSASTGSKLVLRPLCRDGLAGDEIVHRLGDVGGVVADALDVLCREQEVGAEGDIARVLQHVGEELAEQRGVERVDGAVAPPDVHRGLVVLLGVGVEHVLELRLAKIAHVLDAGDDLLRLETAADREHALGDVLGEVADALEIARDADRRDGLAQVDGHRLAAHEGQDGALLDRALERVEPRVDGDHRLGKRRVAADQGGDGVGQHLLGDAAHLRDGAAQILELGVVGADDVVRHGTVPFASDGAISRSGR